MSADKIGLLLGSDPASRERRAHSFQRGHHFETFYDLSNAEAGDEGATTRMEGDQAACGELHQGFADRRPGNAEALGKHLLVELLSGGERSCDDILLESLPEAFGAPHRDHSFFHDPLNDPPLAYASESERNAALGNGSSHARRV